MQLLPILTQIGARPQVRYWREAELPCWTLIVTGRRVREWGFWCADDGDGERFVPWTKFGDDGCGEP